VVVGEAIRQAAAGMGVGLDGLSWRALTPVVARVRGRVGHAREFTLAGVKVRVTGTLVEVTPTAGG
jgi:hypothetical protein